MTANENIEIVRKFNLEMINLRNFNALEDVLHPQYQNRGGKDGPWSTITSGVDKEIWQSTFGEVPTFRVTIEDIFGEGDMVAVRFIWWEGEKPTHNAMAIYRFSDGKIIDDWYCASRLE